MPAANRQELARPVRSRFVDCVLARPALSLLAMVAGPIVLSLAVLTMPFEIDVSINSFQLSRRHFIAQRFDSLVSAIDINRQQEATIAAAQVAQQHANGGGVFSELGRRSMQHDVDPVDAMPIELGRVELVYLPADGGNVFRPDVLLAIHRLERSLAAVAGYDRFCLPVQETAGMCEPPNSLTTLLFPSVGPDGKLSYDGRGSRLLDCRATLAFLQKQQTVLKWFVGDVKHTNTSSLLRAELVFAQPPASGSGGALLSAEKDAFNAWLVGPFQAAVVAAAAAAAAEIEVVWGGDYLTQYEIRCVLEHDVQWAAVSFGLVLLYTWACTGSFSLSAGALVTTTRDDPNRAPAVRVHLRLQPAHVCV